MSSCCTTKANFAKARARQKVLECHSTIIYCAEGLALQCSLVVSMEDFTLWVNHACAHCVLAPLANVQHSPSMCVLLRVGVLSPHLSSLLPPPPPQAMFDASELITQREVVSQRVNEMLQERAESFHLILDDISLVSYY